MSKKSFFPKNNVTLSLALYLRGLPRWYYWWYCDIKCDFDSSMKVSIKSWSFRVHSPAFTRSHSTQFGRNKG